MAYRRTDCDTTADVLDDTSLPRDEVGLTLLSRPFGQRDQGLERRRGLERVARVLGRSTWVAAVAGRVLGLLRELERLVVLEHALVQHLLLIVASCAVGLLVRLIEV